MTDQILEWLAIYGLPVYFLVLTISSAGVPFPITLMMIVAGAFAAEGDLKLWQVVTVGTAGAVAGDNIGYAFGRFGGEKMLDRLGERLGGPAKLAKARKFADRWGGVGIFLSRWLITPLGPWISITSGLAKISWPRFLLWDIAGELLWVLIYVSLGYYFSEYVQTISGIAGDLSWALVGLAAAAVIIWLLVKSRNQRESEAA